MNPYATPTTIKLANYIERPQPTKILTKLRIVIDSIQLNSSAKIRTQLLTEEEDYVEEKTFTLYGIDYTNWKEDSYIFDWAKEKLNITNVSGNVTDVSGDATDVSGNVTDVSGDATDISGNSS